MAAAASPAGSPDSAPDSPNTNSGTIRLQKLVSDRLTLVSMKLMIVVGLQGVDQRQCQVVMAPLQMQLRISWVLQWCLA